VVEYELLLAEPPSGFVVDYRPDGIHVFYVRRGMGCMVAFLLFFTVLWTIGGIMALTSGVPLAVAVVFLVSDLFLIGFLAWTFFGETRLILGDDRLTVDQRVFGIGRTKHAERDAIRSVVQVKDGGEGSDSFPSWGLMVQASAAIRILYRQDIGKSDWLGPVIAGWAKQPFEPTDNREGW